MADNSTLSLNPNLRAMRPDIVPRNSLARVSPEVEEEETDRKMQFRKVYKGLLSLVRDLLKRER